MKRFLYVLLLFVILLCSCETEKDAPPSEFDAKIDISVDGDSYTASFEKRDTYQKVIIESPDYLAGTEFTLSDGVCTVKCGDLVYESESFKAIFDFLPIENECEKICGRRVYRIYDLRGL